MTFTASQSGTYYVRASGDRDETGSYTLRVSDVTPGSVENPPPVEPPAETVAPEEPEPARAAAEDLGDLTELASARFPRGTLDGGVGAVNYYSFTLSEARAVGLGLRRQDADADLVLEDAEGNVLHSSERSGTANEWMRETLLAGTYYVRVEAQEAGANAYVFRYGVGDADPAEVARLEAEQESAQEQVQQQPPAFGSQFYGFDLPENTDGSANRISLGTVSAVDPEGGSVTYSIEGGNAAGLFEIDAASGELFYTGAGEDYETGSTSFELTVRASDGDQTTDTTVTVSVTDVDEPVEVDPPVAEPDQSTPQTVSEPAGEDFSAGASTSGRVAVGDTATGNIGSNGDRDWFAVELVAGRTYVIDLRGSPTDDGTLSDPYLGGIHDSDGNLIARTTNDDGGEGYNSRVTFTATESGTHYIAAGAAGIFSGRGTYEVEVTDTSPPIVGPDPDSEDPPVAQEQVQQQEQDEPPAETVVPSEPETAQAQDELASVSEGDTDLPTDVTTPGRVVVGGSATGNINVSYDLDWFAVELEADKTYRFDLKGESTGGGTLVDPYLHGIYDANGDRFDGTADDDFGVGSNSREYFTPDEGGTYYVSAGAFHGSYSYVGTFTYVGTYTLAVTEIPDDYADDNSTLGRVVVGGSATGRLDFRYDRDWFAVELEADKTYRFDLKGSWTGDGTLEYTYLRGIYDEDGNRIAGTTDSGSGVGGNSWVYFTPDEGATYYVSAGAYGSDAGSYTLAVSETPADDYAADATTTGTVVVGGSATGSIEPSGDTDWFAVTLEAGKLYRFDLKGSGTGDGTLNAPYLRGIYDANGDQHEGTTDYNGGENYNSRVYFRPDEDATYYVSAGGYSNDVGTYTLAVSDATDDYADAYADDSTTTGTVVVGGSATGTIEYNGDRDWFAVTLEAGTLYRFDLEARWTGSSTTLRNPYLRGIYDANGELIDGTTNNNGGESYDSRVYFTPDEDATYYVSAGGYSNRTGTYTLRVSENPADDYAADATTTGTVVVGGSATGNVGYYGDRDWFAVTLEAGKTYQFDLEGTWSWSGTLYDPYLRGIYDAGGNRIDGTTNDDGGRVRNSRVSFTPNEDATYYVSAGSDRDYSGTYYTGTYTLRVSESENPAGDYAANATTTGTVVVGGGPATGNIDSPGDRDWFAVDLEEGKTYRFDLRGSRNDGTLPDPYLRGIYDEDGELIDGTTNDNGGWRNNSHVGFTPDESATYYVSAGAYRDYTGTYTLSVEDVDAM